jgi:hypothetical protein
MYLAQRDEKCIQNWKNFREDHLGDLGIDERTVLKLDVRVVCESSPEPVKSILFIFLCIYFPCPQSMLQVLPILSSLILPP